MQFLAILNHEILWGKNSSTQRVQRINQVQIFFFHAILYTVYLINYNCFFSLFLSWFLLFSSWHLNRSLMSLHRIDSYSGTESLFCCFCDLSIGTCSVGDRKFPIVSSLGLQYSSAASSLYRSNSKWFQIVSGMLTVTEHGISRPPWKSAERR